MTENKIFRLSLSKTKEFLQCKAKYNYSYNLKLPKKEYEFHTFGKFCHKVLEDFHNFYINGCQDSFNISMKKAWNLSIEEYKDKMTSEMKKECYEIINKYLKLVSQNKNIVKNVLACEKKFEINLEDKVILNGMIDRIQNDEDNVVHVADYKTSKSTKYLKNDFFQLLTYAYVISSEDPNIKKVRASYIMLKHDFEFITTEFDQEQIAVIKDQYIGYANQILAEKEFEPSPTILCNWCPYTNLCKPGAIQIRQFSGEVEW